MEERQTNQHNARGGPAPADQLIAIHRARCRWCYSFHCGGMGSFGLACRALRAVAFGFIPGLEDYDPEEWPYGFAELAE